MVYQTEKTLADMGDKLSADDKGKVDAALQSVKTALSGTDTDAIKNATENLKKTFYDISEKLYSQAAPIRARIPARAMIPTWVRTPAVTITAATTTTLITP
jgi:molecular chaperone DnaK